MGRASPKIHNGIRELTSWDFLDTVLDPSAAVLVQFVSKNCSACHEFARTYQEFTTKVNAAQRTNKNRALKELIVARIDQSTNEHSEIIKGTPWLRYWPRAPRARKRGIDVECRSVECLWNFVEAQAVDDADGEGEIKNDIKHRRVARETGG